MFGRGDDDESGGEDAAEERPGRKPAFPDLQPLLASVEPSNASVWVTFRCPATGVEVRSEGAWPSDGLVEAEAKKAKRTLFSSLRNQLSQTITTAAGSGTLGSIGGSAASNLVQRAGNDPNDYGKVEHSEKDQEKAVVAAFVAVQDRFAWEEKGQRWIAAAAAQVATLTPFADHVAAHPLTEAYDQDVMVRLLAALVNGDGAVGEPERASFAGLAPGADLDALVARRPPGAVDFEETVQGPTRETMLLLGWAVALSDSALDEPESSLLTTAATGLGIVEPRATELKALAQQHLVDEAIATLAAAGTSPDDLRAQVETLGEAIGFGADEAARAVIRWQKGQV